MKKITLIITAIFSLYQIAFAQVEDIKKKSQEQGNNNLEETDISNGTSTCGDACATACFDALILVWWQHADFLSKNKDKYPNLFGIQTKGEINYMPVNEILILNPLIEANWSILGIEMNMFRLMQEDAVGFSTFNAYSWALNMNLGLWDFNSLQAKFGIFTDENFTTGNPLWGIRYNWFSRDLQNALKIYYKQSSNANSGGSAYGTVFIQGGITYEHTLAKSKTVALMVAGGADYQQYYGENLFLVKIGLNFFWHSQSPVVEE